MHKRRVQIYISLQSKHGGVFTTRSDWLAQWSCTELLRTIPERFKAYTEPLQHTFCFSTASNYKFAAILFRSSRRQLLMPSTRQENPSRCKSTFFSWRKEWLDVRIMARPTPKAWCVVPARWAEVCAGLLDLFVCACRLLLDLLLWSAHYFWAVEILSACLNAGCKLKLDRILGAPWIIFGEVGLKVKLSKLKLVHGSRCISFWCTHRFMVTKWKHEKYSSIFWTCQYASTAVLVLITNYYSRSVWPQGCLLCQSNHNTVYCRKLSISNYNTKTWYKRVQKTIAVLFYIER